MSESTPYDRVGDLVVDIFGTFLGKRSERMTIRWRDPSSTQDPGPENRKAENPQSYRDAEAMARVLPLRTRTTDPGADGQDDQTSTVENDDHPTEIGRQPAFERVSGFAKRVSELAEPEEVAGTMLENRPWRQRQVAFSRLRSVTVCGRGVTISSDLIEALVERGIHLSFLSGQGQPVASLHAPGLGATVQTRRAQLAAYNAPEGFELARAFVQGKLRNQRHNLLYFAKYVKTVDPERYHTVLKKADGLSNVRRQVQTLDLDPLRLTRLRDQLMGYEGAGGRLYWEGVSALLAGKGEFTGRVTRGATDPVNSALNYGYGILYSHVFGAVANAGLEPFAGFLHVDRPGKPSLVLDLVEEFRAPVVDRPILAWLNQGGTLDRDEHGLTPRVRRAIADRVLDRLNAPVPHAGKRYLMRMVIQMQARGVAKALRENLAYKPFSSPW